MHPDGTIENGAFWLDNDFWIINEYPKISLKEALTLQLKSSREYIARCELRANKLEQWLRKHETS